MSRRKRLRLELDDDHLLDVDFTVDKGRVTRFSVHLRRLRQGTWIPVERIDTHHGHLHHHRFGVAETIRDLAEPRDGNYAADLTKAIERMKELAHADD